MTNKQAAIAVAARNNRAPGRRRCSEITVVEVFKTWRVSLWLAEDGNQRKACLLLYGGHAFLSQAETGSLASAGVVVVAVKRPNQTSCESTTAGDDRYECAGAKSTTAARAGCSRCLTNRAQAAIQVTEAHALIVAVGLFRSAFSSVGL